MKRVLSRTRGPAVAIVLLMLAALIVRLEYLAFFLNADEAGFIVFSRSPVFTVLTGWIMELNPTGYYLLQHLVSVFTDSIHFHKMTAVVPGVLLVPAAYYLGSVHGRVAAYVCALLATFAPGAVIQGQLIRPYSILLLGVTLAVAGFGHAVQGSRRGWYGCAIGCFLAVASHYAGWPFAGIVAAVSTAYISLRDRNRVREWVVLLAAIAVPVAIALPRLLAFPEARYHAYVAGVVGGEAGGPALLTGVVAALRYLFGAWALWGLVPAVILGLTISIKRFRWLTLQLLLLFAAFSAAYLLRKYPLTDRYSVVLFPGVAFLAACGVQGIVSRIPVRPWAGSGVVLAAAAVIVSFFPSYVANSFEFNLRRADFQRVWNEATAQVRAGDLVVVDFQSALYVLLSGGEVESPEGGWLIIRKAGVMYASHYELWNIRDEKDLRRVLSHVLKKACAQGSSFWFLDLGWKPFDLPVPMAPVIRSGEALLAKMPGAIAVCPKLL